MPPEVMFMLCYVPPAGRRKRGKPARTRKNDTELAINRKKSK